MCGRKLRDPWSRVRGIGLKCALRAGLKPSRRCRTVLVTSPRHAAANQLSLFDPVEEPMTDEEVEPIARVAAQLVSRVREFGPDDNERWLRHELPDPADQHALLFVLAALVPADLPWSALTAWTDEKEPARAEAAV